VLYHFETFYVEAKYPYGFYRAQKIKAFEPDSEQLELYIGSIDISALNKKLFISNDGTMDFEV
jgi:hypothetical protein